MNQGRIIVITGSPGTGKTTTASIVAKESDMDKSVHILDTKFIISQIGKQCKPVQVHSFSRFSLRCNLRKFACWGSIPNPL